MSCLEGLTYRWDGFLLTGNSTDLLIARTISTTFTRFNKLV